jgi:hypothetical protein
MSGAFALRMGLSFASADTFRRSMIEKRTQMPHVMPKRGGSEVTVFQPCHRRESP